MAAARSAPAMSAGARRGRRVPLATHAVVPEPGDLENTLYVCGPKSLKMGHLVLHEGVEVPGAAGWLRLESWVAGRRVRKIKAVDEHTSYADFAASQEAV